MYLKKKNFREFSEEQLYFFSSMMVCNTFLHTTNLQILLHPCHQGFLVPYVFCLNTHMYSTSYPTYLWHLDSFYCLKSYSANTNNCLPYIVKEIHKCFRYFISSMIGCEDITKSLQYLGKNLHIPPSFQWLEQLP